MIATLHVPFSNGDCIGGFRHDGVLVTEKYVKEMIRDYREHAPKVDAVMESSFGYNIASNPYEKEHRTYNSQTTTFNTVECQITDKDKRDVTLEKLADYFESKQKFVLIFSLRNMSTKPQMKGGQQIIGSDGQPDIAYNMERMPGIVDLSEDIRQWMRETLKIESAPPELMDDAEKLKAMSTKDLKLTFRGSVMFAVLKKCKMVKVYSSNQFAVLVDRILFMKNR